ncbi:hypothetical protein TRFO_10241 [Tritrichomonas foetus]|uniref:Uncharacterized protein n=1 Tax=Tritrichomonas foetus TaxID=1144522 RepID=A0A1J4JCS1_9EUKA|nr:hypothetical protein TRFO_10241 [Tritrichomonas foetus]|eukprot:OHS96055.1 hypothetical protein TRFO_10241 [Tritrichomonas foetus]
MIKEAEQIAVIKYCIFAFDEIYNKTDPFTFEEESENIIDIFSNLKYLQNDVGGHWIDLVNYSCNKNFKKISNTIRRFNTREISIFLQNTYQVAFADVPKVLLVLMEMFIYKTPERKEELYKNAKDKFNLHKYVENYYSDGTVLLRLLKYIIKTDDFDSFINDEPPKNNDSKNESSSDSHLMLYECAYVDDCDDYIPRKSNDKFENFKIIYKCFEKLGIHLFLDEWTFHRIAESETLIMLHLIQLLDKSDDFEIEIIPEHELYKANDLIEKLFFFETFYFDKSNIVHIKPNEMIIVIDIENQTVSMTQNWKNESKKDIFIFLSNQADFVNDFDRYYISPDECNYSVYCLKDTNEFSLTVSRPIGIETLSIKCISTFLELDSFVTGKINNKITLNIKAPFKMKTIILDENKIDVKNHSTKKLVFESSETSFKLEIVKAPKNLKNFLQYSGLGYFTVEDCELCNIQKIEFNGEFDKKLTGTIKLVFINPHDGNFPIYFYAPDNIPFNNILYNYRSIKLIDEKLRKYYIGRVKAKADHEIKFEIELPGEIIEDEWVSQLPISSLENSKPEIYINITNKNIVIDTFPDDPFIKIAVPLQFNPHTDFTESASKILQSLAMCVALFVRSQRLFSCRIVNTDLDLDLDNSLLTISRIFTFKSSIEKEIYILTDSKEEYIGASNQLEMDDDKNEDDMTLNEKNNIEMKIIDLSFPDIKLYSLGKQQPNKNFQITLKKLIKLNIIDVRKILFDLEFDVFLDKKKNRNTFNLCLHSSRFKMNLLQIGEEITKFKKIPSLKFSTETTDAIIPIKVEKAEQRMKMHMSSIGNDFLSVDRFELWPIERIEFIGTFDTLLEGKITIFYEDPPYQNKLVYHSNTFLNISKVTWDGNEIDKDERGEYILSPDYYINDSPKCYISKLHDDYLVDDEIMTDMLDMSNNQELTNKNTLHVLALDVKIEPTKGEDNWELYFPVTRYKPNMSIPNPSFSFNITNKKILLEKLPEGEELKLTIPYNNSPQELLEKWDTTFEFINNCVAVYFHQTKLIPCEIISTTMKVSLLENRVTISKVFQVSSKSKKTVYIIAHPDVKILWRHKNVAISVDGIPFKAYAIGVHKPGKDIPFVCTKFLEVNDKSIRCQSLFVKTDKIKGSKNHIRLEINNYFAMKNIQILDKALIDTHLSHDFVYDITTKEENINIIINKNKGKIRRELGKKGLGYFTIDNFELLPIERIFIESDFEEHSGELKGQLSFIVPHCSYNESIFYHFNPESHESEIETLNFTEIFIDSEQQDLNLDTSQEFIDIGSFGNMNCEYNTNKALIDIEPSDPLPNISHQHKISFNFSLKSKMVETYWDLSIPITRFKTIQNPQFHCEINNKDIYVELLPEESLNFKFPIVNDPNIIFKDWKNYFSSLCFGFAVYLHQMKIVPCMETQPTEYEIDTINKDVKTTKYFYHKSSKMKEIYIITSQEVELEIGQGYKKIDVGDDIPLNIYSIGQYISDKVIKIVSKQQLDINENSIRHIVILLKNDLLKGSKFQANLHLFTNFTMKSVKFNKEKIKVNSLEVNKEITTKEENINIIINKNKGKIRRELGKKGLGYFTIDNFELLPIERIFIESDFEEHSGELKGQLSFIVPHCSYNESIFYHFNPESHESEIETLNFTEIFIDSEQQDLNLDTSQEFIDIGSFSDKAESENHEVTFSFIIKSGMKENNWDLRFPLTNFIKSEKNPMFHLAIKNKAITVDELPSESDGYLSYLLPIDNNPQELLQKWNDVFTSIHLNTACILYQRQIIKCDIKCTKTIVNLTNNELVSIRTYHLPETYNNSDVYILTDHDVTILNNKDEEGSYSLKTINIEDIPYHVSYIEKCESQLDFKISTTQKIEINQSSLKFTSLSIKNDILKGEETNILLRVIADFNIKSISCDDYIQENAEIENEMEFEFTPKNETTNVIINRYNKEINKLIKTNGLGYFTIDNFEILPIENVHIKSQFNDNTGELEGFISFRAPQCSYNESIFYHFCSTSFQDKENSIRFTDFYIDSEKLDINLNPSQSLVNIGTLPVKIDEENHTFTFSFVTKSNLKNDSWNVELPITKFDDNDVKNPDFLFEIENKGIIIDKMPKDKIKISIPIPNDPHFLLKRVETDDIKPIVSSYYIHQSKIYQCKVMNTIFEINLLVNEIKIIREFQTPNLDDKEFFIVTYNDKDNLTLGEISNDNKISDFNIDEVDYNVFSIGKLTPNSKFSITSEVFEFDIFEPSVKIFTFSFLNDIQTPFSMKINSSFRMKQLNLSVKSKDDTIHIIEEIDCFNKPTIEFFGNIDPGEIICTIEKEKCNFNEGLIYSALGYFTADNFCLLPYQRLEFIGKFIKVLKGEVKYTLTNIYNSQIEVFFVPNANILKISIDDGPEILTKKKAVSCGIFHPK